MHDRKDLLNRISINVAVETTKEDNKKKITKEELLSKVQEIVDLSELISENREDYQYMLRMYRKLKDKELRCPCLSKIRMLTAGYLRDRVVNASGEQFEEIDPDHIKDSNGHFA